LNCGAKYGGSPQSDGVALLEFEHGTLRPEVEEVDLMFDYCKRAVA